MSYATFLLMGKLGRSIRACAVSAFLALLVPVWGYAQLPPNFQSEVFIGSGMTFPTAMEFLPDGTMLITEFSGKIWMVPPGDSQINAIPVLQLTNFFIDAVNLGGERGLTNIVADPNFTANHYIYLFYTAQTPQRDRVSRFTMNGSTADPASEYLVWQGAQDSTTTDHHGGSLGFGPDGKLYISTGDNSDPQSCQLLTSDNGKILRLNSDGTIPTDNPFYDGAGPNIDSIWALGLRNPYRFSFDSLTGRLYIGEVGQNTIEEINLGAAGANYGWPICEGPCTVAGITNPIYSYPHDGRDTAVTGGMVYRGTQFPAPYQGVYFFGDYAQKWIRYLTLDSNGLPTGVNFFQPTDGSADGPYGNPVCFRIGPDGSLYYVDIGVSFEGVVNPPGVRRIRYVGGSNQPPVVVSNASPSGGLPPLTVMFSSTGSLDPEGQSLTYSWTFGDGATSTAANPSHTYQTAGPYQARLSVSDGVNSTMGTPMLIQVGRPPLPVIGSPLQDASFRAGDVITFSGSATDPDDGVLPASAFSWTLLVHHESHIHPGTGPSTGISTGAFVIPNSGHDFSGNTSYEIILTVVDSTGLRASTSVFIYPQKVDLNFSSMPSGLSLNIDGVPYTTPFVKDALINFRYTLQAPTQDLGLFRYGFIAWSDGGAQTHLYTVPATNQALTATYQSIGAAGLTAAWTLDESAGSTAADASGNNHTGTLIGNPTFTAGGKFDGGLVLNGTAHYLQVDNPSLPTGDFTWMLWLNLAENSSFQGFMEAQGASGAEMEMDLQNGRIVVWSNNGLRLTSNGVVPANTWTHVALARKGGAFTVYLNGVADPSTGSGPGTSSFGNCPLLIGADADSGCTGSLNGYLGGTVDEVRIYNRALSSAEIQVAMNSALGTPTTDSTPPALFNLQPAGTLPAGTTQATLSLTTNESAVCRYSLTPGNAYASMSATFSITGGTAHSTLVAGLLNGGTYNYYVRCQDIAGNPNTNDFTINFTVAQTVDTTPPVRSTGAPTGTLASGTTQANMSLTTNENAACRYATSGGIAYASMSNNFTTTGTTAHSTLITGLVNGGSYSYYVRCRDTAGNPNPNDFTITFTVAATQPTGLVAAYGFNEGVGTSVGDASGNGHGGVITGATWSTQGRFGNALSFNGSTNRVTVADAADLRLTTGMTLEAWVFPTSTSGVRDVIIKEGPGSDYYNLYARNWRGRPESNVLVSGTNRTAEGTALAANVWTHLAGTYDGAVLRLFVNGVQVASTNIAGTISTSTGALRVGGNSLWGEYFQGRIDEIRIYNRARTQAEIQTDMNTPVGTPPVDTTPPVRSNGAPTGTLASGTTQTILSLTTNENAACRYATSAGVAYASMQSTFTTTGTTAHSTLITGLVNGGGYNYYLRCQDIAGNPNTNDFTINFTVAQTVDTTPPVRSNGAPTGTLAFGTTQATMSLTTNESAVCRYATSGGAAYASMPNSFTTTGTTVHSTLFTGLVNGGSYNYYVRCQDAAGNPNTDDFTITFTVAATQPTGLVAAYGFNEGVGTSVGDASGNGHNGVITGATWSTQGRFGNALSFNGTGNRVTVADAAGLRLTTGMTLEAWVFPTSTSGVRDVIIKEGPGSDYYNLYARNWRGRPESNVLVSGTNRTAEGTALAANVWTHLAGTYDGAVLRLFVNGVQVASTNIAGIISTSTGALRVGGNSLWGEYFQGRIDEIRIYNRARSQTEIQTEMNTPISP